MGKAPRRALRRVRLREKNSVENRDEEQVFRQTERVYKAPGAGKTLLI